MYAIKNNRKIPMDAVLNTKVLEPKLLFVEKDRRSNNELEHRFSKHGFRAVAAVFAEEDIIIAVGTGHGDSATTACEKALRRAKENRDRGTPPSYIKSYGGLVHTPAGFLSREHPQRKWHKEAKEAAKSWTENSGCESNV